MRILLFADLHIGSIKDTSYFFNVVTKIIDEEVLFKQSDLVVILGDLFDRLFRANDENIALAVNLMSYLVRQCSKAGTKIRLIYGTESHEMNQYRIFNHFLSDESIDIKLITTATEETLHGDRILYLPEEYIDDKYNFYKDTLYGGIHYRYIFGHGVISEGIPMATGSSDINIENKVPRFGLSELSKAGDLVVFGHQHVQWSNGNVHYLGSLFRWKFGEEGPKYYGVIEDGKLQLIENVDAYVYRTYEYPEDSDIYTNPSKLVHAIDRIKSDNADIFNGTKVGRIRLLFHMPPNLDPSWREQLKTIQFTDKVISVAFKESIEKVSTLQEEHVDHQYDFILDSGIKLGDKIHNFIMRTYDDCRLTAKEINQYINQPLSI